MSTADRLLEKMYSWIEHREQCANKLKKLAGELESLRENCNISECIGTTTAVVGTLSLIGAGLATLMTAGAAAPLLGVAGGVCTVAGVGISVVTKITEHLMSSDTTKEAQRIEIKIKETTKNIQKLFEKLKNEKQLESSSADDLDQRVMSEILKAMARRSGFMRSKSMCHNQFNFHFNPESGNMTLNSINFNQAVTVGLTGILASFAFQGSGKQIKLLLAKGGQQLSKEFSKIGLKTALKGGAMAVGGVIGLAFELPEAIDQWKELISNNHVTAASQSLRDTANDLLKISRTLREQLDKIQRMFKDFEKLKSCIENSNRSSGQKKEFIETVEEHCNNKDFSRWLNEVKDTEVFFRLIDIFYFLKQELENKKEKTDREEIDIIFVAHGSIEDPLIPASGLLPLSTIEDVILYSPWNSAINSRSAYGIATGYIQLAERRFGCTPDRYCLIPDGGHWPVNLPYNWNSMKNAGAGMIPTIWVSPLKDVDAAWNGLVFLQNRFGEPGKNRVVIPYVFPLSVPLYVVTFALALVLFIFPFKATFHLAACLNRPSQKTLSQWVQYLDGQYSWAIDHTIMSWRDDIFDQVFSEHPELYRFLRAVFDQ